jgi:hypothetical protein
LPNDLFYLAVVLVFFALTWGLVALFERLRSGP